MIPNQKQRLAVFFAFSTSCAPNATEITVLAPIPSMVPSAMMIENTGLTMETDATFAVSPSWAMKNVSAML